MDSGDYEDGSRVRPVSLLPACGVRSWSAPTLSGFSKRLSAKKAQPTWTARGPTTTTPTSRQHSTKADTRPTHRARVRRQAHAGAIEGVAHDYKLSGRFNTSFRFSRFGVRGCIMPPRKVVAAARTVMPFVFITLRRTISIGATSVTPMAPALALANVCRTAFGTRSRNCRTASGTRTSRARKRFSRASRAGLTLAYARAARQRQRIGYPMRVMKDVIMF